jgi:hypothetical protein
MFYSPVATPEHPMHFLSSFSVEDPEVISTISTGVEGLLRIPAATTLVNFFPHFKKDWPLTKKFILHFQTALIP